MAAPAPVYDDDWEEYDPKSGLTFTHHMVAGSCAGLMEHVLMYPVDTMKVRARRFLFSPACGAAGAHRGLEPVQTHMQARQDLRAGAGPHFRHVWGELAGHGGMRRLWRGVSTMFAAAAPAHAAYFSIYEAGTPTCMLSLSFSLSPCLGAGVVAPHGVFRLTVADARARARGSQGRVRPGRQRPPPHGSGGGRRTGCLCARPRGVPLGRRQTAPATGLLPYVPPRVPSPWPFWRAH
jgi:hypothetical protein